MLYNIRWIRTQTRSIHVYSQHVYYIQYIYLSVMRFNFFVLFHIYLYIYYNVSCLVCLCVCAQEKHYKLGPCCLIAAFDIRIISFQHYRVWCGFFNFITTLNIILYFLYYSTFIKVLMLMMRFVNHDHKSLRVYNILLLSYSVIAVFYPSTGVLFHSTSIAYCFTFSIIV